jgi:hypothetical protein
MPTSLVSLGEIRADVCYPLESFKAVSGLNKSSLAAARRRGLRMIREGKRTFVFGRDWLAYLDANGRVVGPNGVVESLAK